MNRVEINEIVKIFQKVYGDKFKIDQDGFNVWCECLNDLRYDVMQKAANEYIKSNKFPPTIADLREKYDELWNGYKAMLKHIDEFFQSASGIYPCKTQEQEDRARKIFYATVAKFPRDRRESTASSISRKIMKYVKEVESGNSETITPFDEYMEQISNEFTG